MFIIREQIIDFVKILKNKAWIILLSMFSLLMISGIFSFYIIKPEYQAFSTLMIGKSLSYSETVEYNDILLSQKLVSTYSEIAKSRTVSNEVIKNLGLNITYENLRNKINIIKVGDTGLIKIESKYGNPKVAAMLADEIAQVFIKYVKRIMNIENVQVIDRAEIPSKPIKPVPSIYMALAGAAGIIIGVLIVLLIEFLDNTLKTSDDIVKYLKLPVIGVIPLN